MGLGMIDMLPDCYNEPKILFVKVYNFFTTIIHGLIKNDYNNKCSLELYLTYQNVSAEWKLFEGLSETGISGSGNGKRASEAR